MTSDSFRSQWSGSTALHIDCLCVCPQGRLDMRKAAIMGHSFGGATTIQALSQDHRFLSAIPSSAPPSLSLSHPQVWDSSGLLDGARPQRPTGDWSPTASSVHQQLHLPVARQREEDDETNSSPTAHWGLCLYHSNTQVSIYKIPPAEKFSNCHYV